MDRTANRNPRIGEVYMMQFDGSGSEQSGMRPGLVFQNNVGNEYSPNIIALPLTGQLKKLGQPTHVLIKAKSSGLKKDSVVLCENPQRMSKERIGKYLTRLSDADMARVAEANLLASAAIAFIDPSALMGIWQRASRLIA